MPQAKPQNILQQGLLRYLSEEQLQKIQSVKVGIGGAGGLGSNVAMILVRTGFHNIEMLDYDVIDPSNLNRQQYFADEVGQLKTEVTHKRLLDINPDLNLIMHNVEWSKDNADQYFNDCDVIVEAFDKLDAKHKFVDYYNSRVSYMVSGVGMAGLIEKKPMSVKKLGNVYFCGDLNTNTEDGHPPMAPRVIQCAAMMAEVILDKTLNL